MTKTIRLFACGGAGINIASMFEKFRGATPDAGYAKIEPVYIDTSKSNLASIAPNHTYLISGDGVDGSGKIRRENAHRIIPHIQPIINKHQTGDLNIVLSSSTGGSGAVISNLLVNELLKQNKNVVVILVQSEVSLQEIENGIDALKSLQNTVNTYQKPIQLFYHKNSSADRKKVNETIQANIASLGLIFSGQHNALDTKDLDNLLDYTKLNKNIPPAICTLVFHTGTITPFESLKYISCVTLAPVGGDTNPGITVAYHAEGFISEDLVSSKVHVNLPLHLCVTAGAIPREVKNLTDLLAARKRELSSEVIADSFEVGINVDSETGIVL